MTLHNVLIAPQLLVLAIREALELCPPGSPLGNYAGTGAIVACILGIGDEEQAGRDGAAEPSRWAGLDPELAADLVANLHFNRTIALHHLMAAAEDTWAKPWPDLIASRDRAAVGGEPSDLFFEATQVRPETIQQVTVHLYTQRLVNGHVLFPLEFFDRAGIEREDLDRVLQLICTDAATLSASLTRRSSGWAFNALRRWPLLRLDDGRILILRLGWLIERVLSDVTYFDIREHLKAHDRTHGTRRDEAFRHCVQGKLEADTGAALRRTFARRGGRVWHESDLHAAWQRHFPRSKRPKICDYVVQVGHHWLLVDATDRAIPESVVTGVAGADGLGVELERVLTGRKAEQLESTIGLLRGHMDDLTGDAVDSDAVFIPVVATPSGGLPWMVVVGAEARAQLESRGLLQGDDTMAAALMSPKDLSLLEMQSESQGVRAIETLADWRSSDLANWPFDGYLHLTGQRLNATTRERHAAARIMHNAAALSKRNLRLLS